MLLKLCCRTRMCWMQGFWAAVAPFNFTAISGHLAGAPALMVGRSALSLLLTDSTFLFILQSYHGAVLPRRRPHYVLILSVCLSVCPVPPPREKTKRPTNTKLGRKGPWDTSTPWTNFEVKGSEVKVTGHSSCVNVSLIIRISRC